jgi:hypothetical protein
MTNIPTWAYGTAIVVVIAFIIYYIGKANKQTIYSPPGSAQFTVNRPMYNPPPSYAIKREGYINPAFPYKTENQVVVPENLLGAGFKQSTQNWQLGFIGNPTGKGGGVTFGPSWTVPYDQATVVTNENDPEEVPLWYTLGCGSTCNCGSSGVPTSLAIGGGNEKECCSCNKTPYIT